MRAEGGGARLWSTPVGTLGELATAAYAVAAVSGAALAVPFDAADAYVSIGTLLLANPPAVFFRNLHYWAAQLCLVLTLLHAWDHLRARTEGRVGRGVWLRLTLSLPLLAFIMLSGFILRGDPEGRQALRILSEATSQVPLAGPLLATLVFGAADRLDLVYLHHAATATIAVGLFIVEHSRRLWPRAQAFLATTLGTAAVSLVLSPGLHDNVDPVLKGPWYFLGLQEVLHWTPWPRLVLLAGTVVLAALFAVRLAGPRTASVLKRLLLAAAVGYIGLCAVGAFLRGENWSWQPNLAVGPAALRPGWVFASTPDAPAPMPAPLPVVMERPEGCLVCHAGISGLGKAHSPEALGCASCHGGDVFALDKDVAHAGMELIPGNLATAARRCGQGSCHPSIVSRVDRSIMTTMRGVVAVNRAVFGEPSGEGTEALPHVATLSRTPSDTHLRQLCASCHLGRRKTELGPNREESRGGGCNACHLGYSADAAAALRHYENEKARGRAEAPRVHPALSLDIDNGQCFGCHSRSGRISTNYEGWHELHEAPAGSADQSRPSPSRFRVLPDDRVFERVLPDVHQQRGMDCIDCHTANEAMGDGVAHARKTAQLKVACEDCHAPAGSSLATTPAASLDPESRKILGVRAWPGAAPSGYVRAGSGEILVNGVAFDGGRPVLLRKRTGERRELTPTAPVCVEGRGHARLSCGSCHTAWAPRCPTCHTSFDPNGEAYDWVDDADVRGAWVEKGGTFTAEPPTLGVRRLEAPRRGVTEVVETFSPGMVLTIDPGRLRSAGQGPVARRLYARVEPHTTRREARSCESCHNDPVALGYGRGELQYQRTPAGGRWRFTPVVETLAEDGLPADAWVPFLGERSGMVSTRSDVRPFSAEEQRRILRVGACLTCHPADSRVMRGSVRDFDAVLARRSARCVLPVW